MRERTNEQWLADLRGPNPNEALADLYDLLVRGLRLGLGNYGGGVDANAEDFAQEALIKITGNLDSFRGESRFTTWAQKIAMNVALTELRRRRWRDVSLQDVFARREGADHGPADPYLTSEGCPQPAHEQIVEVRKRLAGLRPSQLCEPLFVCAFSHVRPILSRFLYPP